MNHLLTESESNQSTPSNSSEKNEKQSDSKQTARTIRSHARGKINFSMNNSKDNRRVSNRRRMFEKKFSFDVNEKLSRKKPISERSNNNEISNNSDDQIIENLHGKTSVIDRISTNEDANTGGDDDSNSAISTKQTSTHPDIPSLPPNKRRLR